MVVLISSIRSTAWKASNRYYKAGAVRPRFLFYPWKVCQTGTVPILTHFPRYDCMTMKISEIVKKTIDIFSRAGIPDPETDAYELLDFVKGIGKRELLLDPDITFSEEEAVRFYSLTADRARRIPLQHITGRAFLYGREFFVNGNVLVPRFDTEILVEEALKVITPESRVLDLCTGSGCIITALDVGTDNLEGIHNFKEGFATDISEAALSVARINADRYKADNITFVQGDLFANVQGRFDVIVSNPPYIRTDEIEGLAPEVRRFDPLIALDGGDDGLVFYRRIIKRAPCFLNNGGYIFLEIGYDQGEAVEALLKTEGFSLVTVIKDYGGNDRVVSARM